MQRIINEFFKRLEKDKENKMLEARCKEILNNYAEKQSFQTFTWNLDDLLEARGQERARKGKHD